MSSRSLIDCRPNFAIPAQGWLDDCAAAGLDVLVYCTLRSNAEQDELYTHGRTAHGPRLTNARATQSAHNWGLALDFVPLINGKIAWDDHDGYAIAISLAEARGLESLRYSSFPELPHLQLPNWRHEPGVTVIVTT